MSIQKLFGLEKNIKTVSSVTMEQLGQDAESDLYIGAKAQESERFVPPVNYLEPEQFVSYGSAEKYYTKSFDYIRKTYPYDGSLYEKQAWENTASNLDVYLLENKYPRTTGYAIFSPGTWGSVAATSTAENYGLSDDVEYIAVNSGPRGDETVTGSIASLYSDNALNVYDTSKDREDNLKFDLNSSGVTLEFWLKKEAFDITKTGREVIFDLWNGATSGSATTQNDEYGRLRLEMTGGVDAGTFLFTALSGASGVQYAEIGTTITTASVATNTWNHYALTMKNDGSNIKATLYVNGEFAETVSTGSNINRVYPSSGSIANLGSLRHSVSGATACTADIGYGKLSGSIDEFRYWKKERTALQVSRFWFNQVGGGTNTDDNTTDLGLYYKFNEGTTGTSSVDQSVLDYSGRMSNGTWTGYDSTARSTDSAIESYSTNFKEAKDPIIYSNHADYIEAYTEMQNTGSVFDLTNSKSLYHYFPYWITSEDEKGEETLKNITQIMSSYLDELSLQIKYLPRLNDNIYLSGSTSKPVAFAQRKLISRGFMAQDLFSKSTITETLMDNDGERNYDSKLDLVRNFIYENIYNNLISIYKSKGTEKSFRQLLHCFGIDQDIFKINVYSTNDEYRFRDNFKTVSNRTRLISFNPYAALTASYNFKGSIYQMTSSDTNTVSYLTGNTNVSVPMTFEGEFFFPRNEGAREPYKKYGELDSSLFGIHTAKTAAGADEEYDTTWHTPDVANFQVSAVRKSAGSMKAKFMLTSSDTSGIPLLTSSFYDDVYDNNQWNFAVKVRPLSNLSGRVEGASEAGTPGTGADYVVEFYGISTIGNTITHEFSVSASMDYTKATHFMTSSKRMYVGSHYTNFTSSDPLASTDVRVLSNRVWLDNLTNEEIRQHAYDIDNYGRFEPTRNAYLTISGTMGDINIPRGETLALNWDYSTITTSDSDGSFTVPDVSSGSAHLVSRYGVLSTALNNQHSGLGHNFPASDPNVIDVDYMLSAKQQLPEIIQSSDMINILTDADDDLYTRDAMPVKYMLSIEKSMYQTISEEMLNMFASINEFNNLIGEPVNRYRPEYKGLEKLRYLFYEHVANTPDLEKYVDFYKWFDSAIVEMLKQLIPATAITMDNADNIVESHMFERPKYWNKFPTLDSKHTTPETVVKGVGELAYEWKYGHAPQLEPWSKKSLLFVSGSGHALTVADSNNLSFGDGTDDVAFSVSFWMKMSAQPQSDEYLFTKGDGGTAQEYEVYFDQSSARIVVKLQDGTNAKREWAEFAFNPATYEGAWTHMVITYNGAGGTSARNGIKLYVNSAEVSSATTNGISYVAMENTSELFRIASAQQGSAASTDSTFNGAIDEFIVYRELALSSAQVASLYNSGCPTNPTKLGGNGSIVAYWQLGDGDIVGASGIIDSAAAAQHATPRKTGGQPDLTITEDAPGILSCRVTRDENKNTFWWKNRQERNSKELTSDDTNIDSNRNNVLNVLTTQVTSSGQNLTTVAGTKYNLDNYFLRNTTKPYKYGVEKVELKYANKNNDLYKGMLSAERVVDSSTIVEELSKDDQGAKLYDGYGTVRKKKLAFQFFNTGSNTLDYDGKGYRAAPFGIYTSSVDGGYIGATGLSSDFKDNLEINDLHRDLYHTFENEPLQGPFTEKYVGGMAHRHAKLFESDARLRQESFFIEERSADNSIVLSSPGASSSANPVRYFRDELAKRFVNIRNIKHTGSSPTTIGNYEHNYQIVQATGRDVNNLWFRSGSTGEGGVDIVSAESTAVSGVLDFSLPDRTYLSHTTGSEPGTGRNRTVIAERFSAPGGPEVLSRGYLDAESETYSVYNSMNYRNSIVRDSFDYFSQISQTKFGAIDGSSVSSLHYELGGLGTASYHGVPGNALTRATIVEPAAMWNTSSFTFDGTNDYMTNGAVTGLDSMKYTWSAWIKPDAGGSATTYIIVQGNLAQTLFWREPNEVVGFSHSGTSAGTWWCPSNKINVGEWNHVAVAYDAIAEGTPIMCINGEIFEGADLTEFSAASGLLAMGTTFTVGQNLASGGFFDGNIDDIAVFNRVLDDQELKMLYKPTYAHTDGNPAPFNLEQHPAAPHLVSWWTMGDGPNDTASVIEDMVALHRVDHMMSSSTGGNPLTVNGAAASSDCLTVKYYEVGLKDQYDNHFVRNVIPRSDKQYSWITGSLVQHKIYGTHIDEDHQKNNQFERFDKQSRIDGYMSSSFHADGYVQTLEFMSQSNIIVLTARPAALSPGASVPIYAYSYNTIARSGSSGIYEGYATSLGVESGSFHHQDWVGLNTWQVDTFNTCSDGSHIAGYTDSVPIWSVDPYYTNIPNFTDQMYMNPYTVLGPAGTGYYASSWRRPFLNMLLSRRNGPYGWPTFKQIRAGQTQIPRSLFKKQNIYSVINTYKAHPAPYSYPDLGSDPWTSLGTKDLTFKSFKEPAVTSRHKPIRHQLSINNKNSDTGKVENSNIAMAYTHANNLNTFATPELKNKLNAFIEDDQMYDIIKDFYVGKDIDAPGNPVNNSLELKLVDTIYPKAEYTYLTNNRTREKFDFEFWKSARVSDYKLYSKVRHEFYMPNLEKAVITKGRTDYSSFDGYDGHVLEIPFHAANYTSISGSDLATTGSMGQIITVHSGGGGGPYGGSVTFTNDAIRNSFVANQSAWPLDARAEFSSGSCVAMFSNSVGVPLSGNAAGGTDPFMTTVKTKISGGYSGLDGSGELQNDYTIFHNGDVNQFACDYSDYAGSTIPSGAEGGTAGLRAGVLYNRRILEDMQVQAGGEHIFVAAGDTLWTAGEQREQHLKVDGDGDFGPTWNNYEEFSEDLKLLGKDYTIIPEFRISEHMNFYIKENNGNFRTINGIEKGPEGFLTLTGSALSSSAVRNLDDFSQDFFHVYNTSDFIKNFKQVKDDHEGKHHPSSLTFKCKALMKFLPYDGFFPAVRTVQLASMFSQSYGSAMTFEGSYPHLRTAITPLFAPGILYNTIKSGIAVDYPIMTGSYAIAGTNAAGITHTASANSGYEACLQSHHANGDTSTTAYTGSFHVRLPFETLVDPAAYFEGVKIVDSEPHPSASIDSTASINTPVDDLYKMAMHNFLAEVPSFFLKPDEDDSTPNQLGDLTTFRSSPDAGWYFDEDKKYAMEVLLTNAEVTNFNTLFKTKASKIQDFATPLRDLNPPQVIMYERFMTPDGAYNNNDGLSGLTNRQNHGSSFGPATECKQASGGSDEISGSISYMPYTPPYFGGGLARCIIIYSQSANGNATVQEVLEQSEYVYQRSKDYWQCSGLAANEAMQISASINLQQKFKESLKPIYNDNGELTGYEEGEPDSPVHTWAIQTKFETPVLDFTNVTVDLPLSGSGSVARGMWHQYGEIPQDDKGIFLQIRDVDVKDTWYGDGGLIPKWDSTVRSLGKETGFLASPPGGGAGAAGAAMGESSKKKKIGVLNDKKLIKEAVIAIPFRKTNKDKLNFYSLPKEFVNYAMTVKKGADPTSGNKNLLFPKVKTNGEPALNGAGESVKLYPDKTIIEMVKKMQNYVIPPHLDFITYNDMTPFVAYVFEFEHELTKLDLSDIWQNLSPRSLMKVKEPKESVATISHDLMLKDFFGLSDPNNYTSILETDTQWMVFKVKQKASKNYFNKTADSYDQFKFKDITTPAGTPNNAAGSKYLKEYSYNWPYDFFSMVELVKIQAEVGFTVGKERKKGVSYFKKTPAKPPGDADANAGAQEGQGPQGQQNWKP